MRVTVVERKSAEDQQSDLKLGLKKRHVFVTSVAVVFNPPLCFKVANNK